MRELQEEDEDAYKIQFARYISAGIGPDDMEDIYTEAHSKIRANPVRVKKEAKEVEHKRYGRKAMSYQQRKDRIKQKKAAFLRKLAASEA